MELYTSAFHSNTALGGGIYTENTMQVSISVNEEQSQRRVKYITRVAASNVSISTFRPQQYPSFLITGSISCSNTSESCGIRKS